MIIKEFVQKYLAAKDMIEKGKIPGERYTVVQGASDRPGKLVEYNMGLEPRKFAILDN